MPSPLPEQNRWFAAEVLPHGDSVRGYLRARFPQVTEPEDLLQEGYARVLRARAQREVGCARALLFLTVRNLALNWLRRRKVETAWSAAEEASHHDFVDHEDPALAVQEDEDTHHLRCALATLPPRCREVMVQRKVYGRSVREVATLLGVSESTVEAQSAIGVRKCLEYFRETGLMRER